MCPAHQRGDCGQYSFAEGWSDIAPLKALVPVVALVAQFWFGGGVGPSIQEPGERDRDSVQPAAEIALA